MSARDARKLADRLLPDPAARAAFLAALAAGRSARPALLWRTERPEPHPFALAPPVSWQPAFVDILAEGERGAGRHALHEAGAYYCLDLSSVFEAMPLVGLPRPALAIDVCAAPGGKSVFTSRALSPEVLIANEVIGKRLGPLAGNLARCHVVEARIARLDPAALAQEYPVAAQVVLVDAPCSGQSLLARGQANPGAFHPVTVNRCAVRQRRILAESAALVAPGGCLLYTTCTYSRDENEAIIAWFLDRFGAFAAVDVPALAAHRSPHADFPCYRLWPQEGLGAGGFTALMQRGEE